MNQHYLNPAQNMEIKNHILSSDPIYYCDFLSITFKTLSFLQHSFYVSVSHHFFVLLCCRWRRDLRSLSFVSRRTKKKKRNFASCSTEKSNIGVIACMRRYVASTVYTISSDCILPPQNLGQ